jgi:hypothetical protein
MYSDHSYVTATMRSSTKRFGLTRYHYVLQDIFGGSITVLQIAESKNYVK